MRPKWGHFTGNFIERQQRLSLIYNNNGHKSAHIYNRKQSQICIYRYIYGTSGGDLIGLLFIIPGSLCWAMGASPLSHLPTGFAVAIVKQQKLRVFNKKRHQTCRRRTRTRQVTWAWGI